MKQLCKNGHPFDDSNSGVDKRGYRICRVCKIESQRKARERDKLSEIRSKEWVGYTQNEGRR